MAGRAFRDEMPPSMLELLKTYAGRDPRTAEGDRAASAPADLRDRGAVFADVGRVQEI